MAVHQALVEVFTLRQADLPLSMDVNPTTSMPHNEYLRWLAEDASFEETENGEIQLVLGSKDLRGAILDSIMPKESSEEDTAEAGAVMKQQQLIEEGLAEANNNLEQVDGAGGLGGPAPAADPQPVEADRTETDETAEALPLLESLDPSNAEDDGRPIAPANDSWRNVPLEDQAVKFAVGWNACRYTLSANECAGPQAGYAIDRHTYFGPEHWEHNQFKNIINTSRQEAEAEEISGQPHLEGAGRTPERANIQTKIRSN